MNNKTVIFCNNCRNNTVHQLLFSRQVGENIYFDIDIPDDIEWDEFEREIYIWACSGCDWITMQEMIVDTEEQEIDSEYYPSREKHHHFRKSFIHLDSKLSQIYEEIILCYNNSSPILCAAGLRALLEGVCAEKGITGGNLVKKINGLKECLPENIVNSLHHYRFIGNVAVHQLTAPSMDELRSAIEVMEDLLNFLYDLDYKAASLSKKAGLDSGNQQQIQPDVDVIKRVLERSPKLSPGPKTLFRILYQAGKKGVKFEELATFMERTPRQLNGVLGALGRRINNTAGVEGKPGISYLLEIVEEIDEDPDSWGWRMRYELERLIKNSEYPWAADWK